MRQEEATTGTTGVADSELVGPYLVELYEYKVADLLSGRTPRPIGSPAPPGHLTGNPTGHRAALNELRHLLLRGGVSGLPAAWQRRLRHADRMYRQWQRDTEAITEAAAAAPREADLPGPLPTAQTDPLLPTPLLPPPLLPTAPQKPTPATSEAETWLHLQVLAWYSAVRARLHQVTQQWRQEPERPSLRVLYAVLENAERRLRGVSEPFAVPSASDPLVSLGQQDIVHDLTNSLAELMLTPQGRAQVQQSAAEVRREPFPQSSAAPAYPHAPQERPQVREAAAQFQRLLADLLADLPQTAHAQHILYAPTSPLLAPDEASPDLTLYLGAEVQDAYWHNLHIRWERAGKNWQVMLGQQMLMLYPHLPPAERHATLRLRGNGQTGAALEAFYDGNYLLLRQKGEPDPALASPLQTLTPLVAQARALAVLLAPDDDYAALRLARAADQDLRGLSLNLAALTAQSAQTFRQASPETLRQFARTGLQTLLERLAAVAPAQAQDTLTRCAAALELAPAYALRLHEALHNALYPSENVPPPSPYESGITKMFSPNGLFQTFELGRETLSLSVRGRVMTLKRNYQGEVMLSLPGYAEITVPDVLALPLNDTDLLLACHAGLVAVAALPHQSSTDAFLVDD